MFGKKKKRERNPDQLDNRDDARKFSPRRPFRPWVWIAVGAIPSWLLGGVWDELGEEAGRLLVIEPSKAVICSVEGLLSSEGTVCRFVSGDPPSCAETEEQ